MRQFAIGDIHGCSKALRSLIELIDPGPEDELVFLGDYVDRGPDSRDVVDQIITLREDCRVVALRGNHEIMLLGVACGGLDDSVWLSNGGLATVTSYGGCLSKIPPDHLAFFQDLVPYYESSSSIFVHAGYAHQLAMHEQHEATTYWNHLATPVPPPHQSGKRVFVGHTPQASGSILDAGHVVCLDTYCFGGGFLTAYEIGSDEVIQTDIHGHPRRAPLLAIPQRLTRLGRAVADRWRRHLHPASQDQESRRAEISLLSESPES
jgi:serine/threonine protein phosphatase 1